MINFDNSSFVTSFVKKPEDLELNLQEILFVGRSNVGKSSLINSITNKKRLAFTSSKPGHTKLLNYYNVDKKFYLVDAPGYGYGSIGSKDYIAFGKLMESYFKDNINLSLVCFLLDSRRVPNKDDADIFRFLIAKEIPFIICVTKIDKINQSEKAKILKNLKEKEIEIDNKYIFYTSITKKDSLNKLKSFIEQIIE